MMDFLPYKSLGPFSLDMTKEDIRAAAGDENYRFLAGASGGESDAFEQLGLSVYYDENGKCEAIEAYEPANPSILGVRVLGRPYSEVVDALQGKELSFVEDDSGAVSMTHGFSLYVPNLKDGREAVIESMMAFRHGYDVKGSEELQKELLKSYGLASLSEYGWMDRVRIRIRKFLN